MSKLSKYVYVVLLSFILILVSSLGYNNAFADTNNKANDSQTKEIKIYVNQQLIETDVKPVIINGTTVVPVRLVGEPLGAIFNWEGGEAQKVTVQKNGITMELKVDNKIALVDNKEVELDVPATLISGRVMVPLRFVSEQLNSIVSWEGETKTIYITYKNDEVIEAPEFKIMGYYYSSSSLNNLKQYNNVITDVLHFGYELDKNANLIQKERFNKDKFYEKGGGYETAKEANINKFMVISDFSKKTMDVLLNDTKKQDELIVDIINEIHARNLDGVDIDFEQINVNQRDNFTNFIKNLREILPKDKKISMALTPRSADYQFWLDAFDYKALAQYADSIVIMTYNEHYPGGEPGPVASVGWVQDCVDYMVNLGVPKEKLVVGLGMYGCKWLKGGNGATLTNTNAKKLAEKYNAEILRDEVSGCLHFNYKDENGKEYEVWFEDATSLGMKAKIAKDNGLAGIALWQLGNGTDEIFASLIQNTIDADFKPLKEEENDKEENSLDDLPPAPDYANGQFLPAF